MSSASPSPTPSSRDELMFLGTECHHASCHLHDFLPFYCPACKKAFCQPHFLPSQHACTAPLPPSMVDRIAPQCPMCNEVVSYPPGTQDPNAAVEQHILSGTCTEMEGGAARKRAILRARKDKGEVCYRRGCTKKLIVPLKCERCTRAFCPTHRQPDSHACSSSQPASGASTPSGAAAARPAAAKSAMSRLLSSAPSSKPSPAASRPQPVATVSTSTPLDARAAAAAAAMKRAGQDVKVPFVKTKEEKRAKDELQSSLQALKARHDKGLLTKAEQVRYAEMVGKQESSRRKSKDKDCIIA